MHENTDEKIRECYKLLTCFCKIFNIFNWGGIVI